jgi:hypothetical protein
MYGRFLAEKSRKEVIKMMKGGHMAKYCYLKATPIRELAKTKGKRCSADFFNELDIFIEETVNRACNVFNGHSKRLTREVVQIVLGKLNIK